MTTIAEHIGLSAQTHVKLIFKLKTIIKLKDTDATGG
jgi:hypothetical protein